VSCLGRHWTLVVLVLFGLLLAGCAEKTERTGEATALARQYLAAVAGGSDDRGWSLLHPDARRDMFGGSMERYVNGALASDWTDFDFRIDSVEPDDPGLYFVRLKISPPGFLVQTGDGNLRILANAESGAATMAVRFDTFARGVWPSGG
jgi:uncharacterized protein YceK